MCEKVLSKEHPDTLGTVYWLAYLLAKQDLYDEATTLYQRACDGYSVVLGDDHPTARACQQDYSEMLQRKEQRRPIVSSEVPLTVLGDRKRASKDASTGSLIHTGSRLSRGMAKLRFRTSKHDK